VAATLASARNVGHCPVHRRHPVSRKISVYALNFIKLILISSGLSFPSIPLRVRHQFFEKRHDLGFEQNRFGTCSSCAGLEALL
jgi:hypothetical protein